MTLECESDVGCRRIHHHQRRRSGIPFTLSGRTDGKVELGTGTLYGIVKRLLADGLAEESSRRGPAHSDDPRRRYYKLTPFGRQVVAAETDRLEAMVASARSTRMLRKGAR